MPPPLAQSPPLCLPHIRGPSLVHQGPQDKMRQAWARVLEEQNNQNQSPVMNFLANRTPDYDQVSAHDSMSRPRHASGGNSLIFRKISQGKHDLQFVVNGLLMREMELKRKRKTRRPTRTTHAMDGQPPPGPAGLRVGVAIQ